MPFQKGHKPFHPKTEEAKERKLANLTFRHPKGNKPTHGFKKGHKFGVRFKKGERPSPKTEFKKGQHFSKKTEFKKGSKINLGRVRLDMRGANHWNWKGGINVDPYGLEFNENLKEVIRNRDRRKCRICEMTELENKRKLEVHHIDYNKENCDPKNLITLCLKCHGKTNYNREYWTNYFNTLCE
jgi:hypothetical protein